MFVTKCRLFDGISAAAALEMLSADCVRNKTYKKGELVISEGDIVRDIAVVKSGSLEGVRYMYDGGRDIAAVFGEGDVFGDVLASSGGRGSPVNVVARTEAEVVFLPFDAVISSGGENRTRLLANLMRCVSDKYFALNFRIMCLTRPTLREKIMLYLESMEKNNGEPFNIPLDRETLADFLCVDRSALSRELSRLKGEGVVDYYKNTFKINKKQKKEETK